MMFIRVVLEDFLSPKVLMLKAPSSREVERCSRAKNRPSAHSKRILGQRGQIVKKDFSRFWLLLFFFCFFLNIQNLDCMTPGQLACNRLQGVHAVELAVVLFVTRAWKPHCGSERRTEHLHPWTHDNRRSVSGRLSHYKSAAVMLDHWVKHDSSKGIYFLVSLVTLVWEGLLSKGYKIRKLKTYALVCWLFVTINRLHGCF